MAAADHLLDLLDDDRAFTAAKSHARRPAPH
jgi:hypothetical protein